MEYTIDIVSQETGDSISYTTTGNSSSFTIEGLHPDYFYTYRISAATAVGSGPLSEIFNIRMPEDGKTNTSNSIKVIIFVPFLQYPLVPQLMHLQVQSIQRLFLLLGSFLCLKIAMAISLATPS